MRLFIFFSLFFSQPAFAAYMTGNGGDVLSCQQHDKNQKKLYEILDLFEARTLNQLEISRFPINFTAKQIIEIILSKISKYNPSRAVLYRQWLDAFTKESRFIKNIGLVDIPDSLHMAFPTGCKTHQIAVQTAPDDLQPSRYTIADELWQQLNPLNQAALMLHEIVYREALSLNHGDSRPTRNFVGRLFSTKDFSEKEYIQFIYNLGFVTTDYKELRIRFSNVGRAKQTCYSGATIYWHRFSPPEFFPNGQIKTVETDCGSKIDLSNEKISIAGSVEFYENGALKSFIPTETIYIKLPRFSLKTAAAKVELYDNGIPKELISAESIKYKGKLYNQGQKINFDTYGNIKN